MELPLVRAAPVGKGPNTVRYPESHQNQAQLDVSSVGQSPQAPASINDSTSAQCGQEAGNYISARPGLWEACWNTPFTPRDGSFRNCVEQKIQK